MDISKIKWYNRNIKYLQLFASKYKTILPTEEELADMISKQNIKLLETQD